jgi:Asp-tRNA(Asn)/Glu-tRNA(Gln) amidotransferase A subunit family amidase
VFDEYDAILTLATPGEAPRGIGSTGNAIFCTLWTYLGTPAVTLPLLSGPSGMPLGVQLVGRRGGDARLLRTARWLVKAVADASRKGRRSPETPSPPTRGERRRGRS